MHPRGFAIVIVIASLHLRCDQKPDHSFDPDRGSWSHSGLCTRSWRKVTGRYLSDYSLSFSVFYLRDSFVWKLNRWKIIRFYTFWIFYIFHFFFIFFIIFFLFLFTLFMFFFLNLFLYKFVVTQLSLWRILEVRTWYKIWSNNYN